MALEQLKMFLVRMQDDPDLKAHVLAAATADDEAKLLLVCGTSLPVRSCFASWGKRWVV